MSEPKKKGLLGRLFRSKSSASKGEKLVSRSYAHHE